jgi:diguanylate cyclase (GGDEF)-like protein
MGRNVLHDLSLQKRKMAWITTILILVCFGVAFGFLSYQAREDTWRLGEQSVDNVTRLAEQLISRDIEIYDLSLQAVIDGVLDPTVMSQDPKSRANTLLDRSTTAKGFGFINVTDEKGMAILDSKSIVSRNIDMADRDFFTVHRNSVKDTGLFISRPFRSRLDHNRWTIALSRKITGRDGIFRGVVAGYISVEYLNDILRRSLLGSSGIAAIMRDDGYIIARSVFDDRLAAMQWRSATLLEALKFAPRGRFVKRSLDDGVMRLYSYGRIDGTALAITTGVAVDQIYGPWWSRSIVSTAVVLLLITAVIILVRMLDKELIGRVTAEHNAQLLARTDGLTGVANRRMFDETLERELVRAQRQKTHVSLLMIDVDWFKKYNDAHGHNQGDKTLVQIAATLQAATRSHFDLVARYGGEEFAIIFLHDHLKEAPVFAMRVVEAIRGLGLPFHGSPVGQVTVSCGVATCSDGLTDAEVLLKKADAALYEAKAAGRNQFRDANKRVWQVA